MQPLLSLGPLSMSSYTAALTLAIALSALAGWRLWAGPARAWGFISLCVLVGGVLGGRAAHVLAHWDYFQAALEEALRINGGGLDWWGAVLGGIAGAAVASRFLRTSLSRILDALTPALPLLALAGSVGCYAAMCAYGAEIPTLAGVSPLVAAELPDVFGMAAPRYQTQVWIAGWSLLLLALVGLWFWRRWLVRWRFWLTLALLTLGMAVIGPYRAA
ncbi:MAG TPA: prolipoprotein diacylglyceryl transferase family protein [Candidatus Limnocylindrales bacterium]|nr:prolipoprotein diacylglyceryl transferase family protein [Candidatus Limnocylindrales bacterium]